MSEGAELTTVPRGRPVKPPPSEPALAEITVDTRSSVVVEEKPVVVEQEKAVVVEEVELSQLEVTTSSSSSVLLEVTNSQESLVAWELGEEVRHLHLSVSDSDGRVILMNTKVKIKVFPCCHLCPHAMPFP